MKERSYYNKFKESVNLPLLKYFSKLDLEDWIDFFNDYYRHELTYLLRILDTPKGENIYSYGLIWVNEVDSNTKNLITRSNDTLLSVFIKENDPELLVEIFKAIRYLQLDVNKDLLFQIIINKNGIQNIRELAAVTLISVHENSTLTFWDNLDLMQDKFLIPSYISFQRMNNPIKGLEKLKLIVDRPKNVAAFEIPILYSLLQASTSNAYIEEYEQLQSEFPPWVSKFISQLFDDYKELDSFQKKLFGLENNILFKHGLNKAKVDWLEVVLDISRNKKFLTFTNDDWQFRILAGYVESRFIEFNPKSVIDESETAYIILLAFVTSSTRLYNRYTDVIAKLEEKYTIILNISSVLFGISTKNNTKVELSTTTKEAVVPSSQIIGYYERNKQRIIEYEYEAY